MEHHWFEPSRMQLKNLKFTIVFFLNKCNIKILKYKNIIFMIKLKSQQILDSIHNNFLKKNIPDIKIGDNVRIGFKIFEGNKERIQFYEGIVIARKNSSINTTITVRKILQGIGVERIFLINSPKVSSIDILRSSKVRKSKLYYLRQLKGKASRLKQLFR